MNTLRAGQVAWDPDLSGPASSDSIGMPVTARGSSISREMPRLRFLRQIGAVALILNMSQKEIDEGGMYGHCMFGLLSN